MSIEEQAVTSTVNIAVNGVETALKITGAAATTVAAIVKVLANIATKERHGKLLSPGEKKIKNILTTDNTEIFTINQDQLNDFAKRAKDYGLQYTVLGKKETEGHFDGKVDIIVPQSRANTINHIIEAFNIDSFVKSGTIQNDNPVSLEKLDKDTNTMGEEFEIKGEESALPKETLTEEKDGNRSEKNLAPSLEITDDKVHQDSKILEQPHPETREEGRISVKDKFKKYDEDRKAKGDDKKISDYLNNALNKALENTPVKENSK